MVYAARDVPSIPSRGSTSLIPDEKRPTRLEGEGDDDDDYDDDYADGGI